MRGFPKIWRASHFPNSARYSGKLYKKKKNNKKMQKSLVIFPERAIISFAKYRKNIMFLQGALAQLGARNIRIVEARGSNPLCSILTGIYECICLLYVTKNFKHLEYLTKLNSTQQNARSAHFAGL